MDYTEIVVDKSGHRHKQTGKRSCVEDATGTMLISVNGMPFQAWWRAVQKEYFVTHVDVDAHDKTITLYKGD